MAHNRIIIPNNQTPIEGNHNVWHNFFINSFVNYIRRYGHISPEQGNVFAVFIGTECRTYEAVLSNDTNKNVNMFNKLNEFLKQSSEDEIQEDDYIMVKYTNCAYYQNDRNFWVLIDGQLYFFDF